MLTALHQNNRSFLFLILMSAGMIGCGQDQSPSPPSTNTLAKPATTATNTATNTATGTGTATNTAITIQTSTATQTSTGLTPVVPQQTQTQTSDPLSNIFSGVSSLFTGTNTYNNSGGVAGCDYSKASLNTGWGYNNATRLSCAPLGGSSGTTNYLPGTNVQTTGTFGSVGGYSCDQQKAWGKCSESWMHPVCDSACGSSGSTNYWPGTNVQTTGTFGSVGGYTCEQQQAWGKCSESWMHPVCDSVCG